MHRLMGAASGILVWATALLAVLPCAAENDRDGLVLGIVGKWRDATQKDGLVHFGSVLSDKSIVSCDNGGSLTVWFQASQKPVPIPWMGTPVSISALKEENAKHSPPKSLSDVGAKLWELVTPLIHQEPRSYVAAVSRGFGNVELEESVAALRNGQVDLSAALEGAPAGKYAIAFLATEEQVPDSPAVQVNWQPGRAATVNSAAHPPANATGVVKIGIAAADGTLSGEAWLLLTPPNRYETASARFREARSTVVQWPGGTRSQASRSVLRACLRALSQRAE